MYSEAAYFDGHPCKHVADWEEAKRIERLRRQAETVIRRAGISRDNRKGEKM